MNIIFKFAAVLFLCFPTDTYAKQLIGDDFTKACSGGTKTCHLVSNDRGATWVGPFCGPCSETPEILKRRSRDVIKLNSVSGLSLNSPGADAKSGDGKTNVAIVGAGASSTQTFNSASSIWDDTDIVHVQAGVKSGGKVTNDREKITMAAPGGGSESPAIFDRWENAKSGEGAKSISIDIKDYEAAAKTALQELADAYSAKRRTAFMRLVSPDFSGDVSTFEDALVKDFRTYNSVNLSLTPDRVVVQGDMVSVEFHYNLTVVNEQGANKAFSGRSNYTFRLEDGKARLYKMEKPVIFGNSLPSSENPMNAGQNSLAAAESAAPGMQGAIRGSAVVEAPTIATPGAAFSFETHSATLPADLLTDLFVQSPPLSIWPSRGGVIVSIGDCNLDSVTSMPGTIGGISATAHVGECYALKTGAGKYAVIRVTWVPSIAVRGMGFTYKFQPSGSNAF